MYSPNIRELAQALEQDETVAVVFLNADGYRRGGNLYRVDVDGLEVDCLDGTYTVRPDDVVDTEVLGLGF
jgi:hypothetical protein